MKRKLLWIFFAFCISFITMVALSLFSLGRFATFTDYSAEVGHSNRVIRTLYRTEVFLKDMDRWERGYILTGDTAYLRVVKNVIDSLGPSLDALEKHLARNPLQTKNIIFLRSSITSRINYGRQDIAYIDSTHSKEASKYYFEGRKSMITANRTIREMHRLENSLLAERYKKQEFYERLTTSTLKTLLAIFCIITLILFLLLMKLLRSGMLYQEELQVRLTDLKRSHEELQDIAYAISHDLQEPLRKIQVFSNMLLLRKNPVSNADTNDTLLRINNSANRMQLLISDLVNLTNLTKIDESRKPIDLNTIVESVLADMDAKTKEKEATIDVHQLPVIDGYEAQLKILFDALLDNALKFSNPGSKPHITITHRLMRGNTLKEINPSLQKRQFHCISVADNGIGFDNRYIDNIFKIFKRLHAEQSQYEGKGIGLVICQRIMTNHGGYVIGEGIPNEGATFRLFFPMEP